jgi:NADPH:quinone reductase-like Zn-dependent oxidoreductase/acyl carrier protein
MGAVGWLSGRVVHNSVVFPATGFIDVVLCAGDYVGCSVVDELVLHTPLALFDYTPTDLQLSMRQADELGRRRFSVHARTGGDETSAAWILHASGVVGPGPHSVSCAPAVPAAVIEAIDLDDFYQSLAELGFSYSGPFRSLRGFGRPGDRLDVVYVEVELPADTDITGYGIHPALLDAVLHPLGAAFYNTDTEAATARLPFAFSGISLHATAATRLHVELVRIGADTFRLHAVDPTGAPVISIDAFSLREVPPTFEAPGRGAGVGDSVFELAWPALPDSTAPAAPTPAWVVVTEQPDRLPASLRSGVVYPGLDTWIPAPGLVIWPLPLPDATDEHLVDRLHAVAGRTLRWLQDWLARPDTVDVGLVVLTRHAVTTGVDDRAPDLVHAAVWALIHSAQNEHPGRIVLVDADDTAASADNLSATLGRGPVGEPQLALRDGIVHIPRLTRSAALVPPDSGAWKLATTGKGDVGDLVLVESDSGMPLGAGQIRVQVRAAGLNFDDVDVVLGAVADGGLGVEASGVVIDTGPGVAAVRPGDAVMGLFRDAFSTTAVTDYRAVVVVPSGWSFMQAASVPVAFLTAYVALVEVAGVCAGQRVLILGGAEAVGQAAIQVAGHFGAEVFVVADPAKHDVVQGLGVPADRIASSCGRDFVGVVGRVTGGGGVDVVLSSCGGDLVDASFELFSGGGCFIDVGKADMRRAADIAAAYPAVAYRGLELGDIALDRLQRAWAALAELFAAKALRPLPTVMYGVCQARQAFGDVSQGLHGGKVVLVFPGVLNPGGTVVITGGTGMLGGVFAEHLITRYGIKHLLLLSRRGLAAVGVAELEERLTGLGAEITVRACDVGDPVELAAVLDAIPVGQPLTAVIHAAGEQLDAVLRAKADAAWYLDQLTADRDLQAFVLFSSAAAILGAPGQANYAAANAFLDALAQQQHRRHRRITSLAWGYWQTPTGMTAQLPSLRQATRSGLAPIATDHGLALFDAALSRQQPVLFVSPISRSALASKARQNTLPSILSALAPSRPQATASSPEGLAARLAGQTAEQQLRIVTTMVARSTAAVLAHVDPVALDTESTFKDLGIDSLTALELRNTLATQTGLTLPATVVFDHPTPAALAKHLHTQMAGTAPQADATDTDYFQQIQELIASIPANRLVQANLLEFLQNLLPRDTDPIAGPRDKRNLADMSIDDLVAVALDKSKKRIS